MTFAFVNRTGKGDKFFWNIDAKVGANAANKLLDVQLIQLGYVAMLASPANKGKLSQAEVDAFSKIKPGANCTGREDDLLVRAIRAHEASRGGAQDGVVSPLGQGHISYTDASGPHTLILLALNNSLRDVLGDSYPRIDLHADCPTDLKNLSRATFSK
jgi:hypothetical protein